MYVSIQSNGRGRLGCCEERMQMGEIEEMGDYPTTSCSSDMESSRGSDDSRFPPY